MIKFIKSWNRRGEERPAEGNLWWLGVPVEMVSVKGCWLFGGRSYTGKEVGCGVADAGFSGGGEQEREEEQLWVVTVKETDMREMEGKKLMAGEGNCSPAVGRRLGSGEGGNGEAGDWRREKDSF
ncbi:hypothetical protein OIU77_010109 [Salix suchowensis]|uniref:Uncharacterized protein n=1 Tax=Salix suchowensis TaxID=1278906 RepID=A0ABQ9A8E2_9ROSI|nr:hypothetical protein OIU77_010109 [Salix suchowensis]